MSVSQSKDQHIDVSSEKRKRRRPLSPEKKNEWGFVGTIEGRWIEAGRKEEILIMMEWAKEKGISVTRICALLMISRKRIVRWRKRWKSNEYLHNGKPGPKHPIHRLLPEEKRAVLDMAKREEYSDLSHRTLAVTARDKID